MLCFTKKYLHVYLSLAGLATYRLMDWRSINHWCESLTLHVSRHTYDSFPTWQVALPPAFYDTKHTSFLRWLYWLHLDTFLQYYISDLWTNYRIFAKPLGKIFNSIFTLEGKTKRYIKPTLINIKDVCAPWYQPGVSDQIKFLSQEKRANVTYTRHNK